MSKKVWTCLLAAIAVVSLSSCGSSDDSTGIFFGEPQVDILNAPSSLRFGQTAFLDVEVETPEGARGSDFMEIRTIDPFGQQSFTEINASDFGGCFAGATFCRSDDTIAFQVPSNGPSGNWTVTIRAFDQTGDSDSDSITINVLP
jgi:hypothetical protein